MIKENTLKSDDKTVLLGLGNEILGDDSIGLVVGKIISDKLSLTFKKSTSFGFDIIETISGYKHIILIDAVIIPEEQIGTVIEFNPDDFEQYASITAPHTFNLPVALKFLSIYNESPEQILIFGINIKNELKFSENLSSDLEYKLDSIVNHILKRLAKTDICSHEYFSNEQVY